MKKVEGKKERQRTRTRHCENERKREIHTDIDQERLRDMVRQGDIMRNSQYSCADCCGSVGAVFTGFASYPDLTF